MKTRTKQRIANSISARVAVAGITIVVVCGLAALAVQDGQLLGRWAVDGRLIGTWAGVMALVGIYVTLVSLVVLAVVEFLRYTGY